MSEVLKDPAFIYACIGIVTGFLSVVIMTVSEGKSSDPIEGMMLVFWR